MRRIFLCSTFAAIGFGQGLIEKALVTGAGATAASTSGQLAGSGVRANLGGLAAVTASAAGGGGGKPSPFGEGAPARRASDLPQVQTGPEAAVGATPMPSPRRRMVPDSRPDPQSLRSNTQDIDRTVKAQPVLEGEGDESVIAPQPQPQPVVLRQAPAPRVRRAPEPPRRIPSIDEFKTVEVGSQVNEAIAKLGLPSSRFSMWDDGHLSETLRYESNIGMLARIKSVDGKVISVEIPNL